LKNAEEKILNKKYYIKPLVSRIVLDNSISLVMMTTPPVDPHPRGGDSKGGTTSTPFSSPFGDKPFS
jgi:hypothetical protein